MSEAAPEHRLLLVEDSDHDAALVLRTLRQARFPFRHVRVMTREAFEGALDRDEWDLVVSDYSLPQFSGREALAITRGRGLDLPFVVVSGTVGEEAAVELLKAGANDYLLKDKLTRLAPALERELRDAASRRARRAAEESLRQRDEQLRHAQKMEAIGRLAGGVAHDFNNLLSVVLCNCEIMRAEVKGNAFLDEALDDIHGAARRAADLTRQLLLFSRQEVQQLTTLSLNDVITGMEKLLRRVTGEDVKLVIQREAGLGAMRADPGHVEQVLMNLVVNARDAMPRGGTLTIETRTLRERGGAKVLLTVSDTGMGMDAATSARIFEPFFTTKERGKGTGLGLSTVFGIVQQAGGSIEVETEPGKGTTFRLRFPCVDEPARARRTKAEPRSLSGDEKILLVEDEEQVRAVAARILRRSGYSVVEARNAQEALRIADDESRPIDLLVTDVVMPEMSGPELAQRMAEARPRLRLICMSGYTDDSIARHGLPEGVAFLQKPLTPDALTRKVREVLDAPSR